MASTQFYLSEKYHNYKKILKSINQKCELENDLNHLSFRLKIHYKEFLEIKEEIINSKNNLTITKSIDESKFKLTIQSLRNVSKSCINDKFVLGKDKFNHNKILNDEIEKMIKIVELDFKFHHINIDLILNVFRLIDFEKELKENSKSIYKLYSLFLDKNEELMNLMYIRIYGQNFEQINKLYLKGVFGKDLNSIQDLDKWNYMAKKHQYNIYVNDQINKNRNYIDWNNFNYGDKRVDHKFRVNIPSLDLEVKMNNKQYYIETKNFTENNKNEINLCLNHNSSQILNRLNVQTILEKDNCMILYNINIYNEKNFYSFLIPIHELKKFYQKIDNSINSYTKLLFKEDIINKFNNKIDLEINNEKISCYFDIKNKEINNNLYIKMKDTTFYNIFKNYIINNEHDLDISDNLSKN